MNYLQIQETRECCGARLIYNFPHPYYGHYSDWDVIRAVQSVARDLDAIDKRVSAASFHAYLNEHQYPYFAPLLFNHGWEQVHVGQNGGNRVILFAKVGRPVSKFKPSLKRAILLRDLEKKVEGRDEQKEKAEAEKIRAEKNKAAHEAVQLILSRQSSRTIATEN